MAGSTGQLNLANVLNLSTYLSPAPMWVKVGVAIPFQIFQTAATTINVNLFTLPIGGIIHGVKIKHSTAFAGTSITAVTLSVGIAGTVAKYASAFDVFQAVSGTAFQLSNTFGAESMTATTQMTATMTSTGANLSSLTAGTVDIWALMSATN